MQIDQFCFCLLSKFSNNANDIIFLPRQKSLAKVHYEIIKILDVLYRLGKLLGSLSMLTDDCGEGLFVLVTL